MGLSDLKDRRTGDDLDLTPAFAHQVPSAEVITAPQRPCACMSQRPSPDLLPLSMQVSHPLREPFLSFLK